MNNYFFQTKMKINLKIFFKNDQIFFFFWIEKHTHTSMSHIMVNEKDDDDDDICLVFFC